MKKNKIKIQKENLINFTNSKKIKDFFKLFTNKKVIISILITIAILVIFRVGALVALPGVNFLSNSQQTATTNNNLLSLMNLLGGGGLSRVSFFALGVSPYITAQIIMQLLSTDLVKPVAEMLKSGEAGKRKYEIWTRIVTLPFAFLQAYAVIALLTTSKLHTVIEFNNGNPLSQSQWAFYIFLLVGGCYASIFLGDVITKRGVGNGITLIIASGIIGSLISDFQLAQEVLTHLSSGSTAQYFTRQISFILYVIFFFIIIIVITFMNESVRKIPVQQIGQGMVSEENKVHYLPIKVNSAGVIPVIFAASLMSIPSTVQIFYDTKSSQYELIQNYFTLESWSGICIYLVLTIIFTFFYSYVQINPERQAQNFKKSGKFILGVRAGEETEKYISRILLRVNCIGAPFLAIIASIPYFVGKAIGLPFNDSALGGTGMIIIVAVCLQTWLSIKSAATSINYNKVRKSIELQTSVFQPDTTIITEDKKNDNSKWLW